ncbi:MAG: glycosyltransferase [Candidatus Peregrinibacteria bacterium]|nr:glycosyltransferase [Candidatus Peregrinibacteria bacterium]MCB9808102.1 glycosyltransferase [Candidatus Peribacteria bacterium]
MPKVSVLIPIYKPNPKHLEESLDGLLKQSEQDFEAIICEEPTDVDSSAVLTKYVNDPRFQHFKNEKCLGIGGNWNRCYSKATSPVIAYLFQDDLWASHYLETALEVFEKHKTVGIISMYHEYQYDEKLWTLEGYELVKEVQKEIESGVHEGGEILRYWLHRNMHPNIIGEPPFVVLKKEVMEEVGPFHENMPQFLDVEYWLRCLQKTDWYFEKKSCGAFRVHGAAASAQNNESGKGLYDRLTVFEKLIKSLHGDLRKVAIRSRNRSVEDMIGKFFNRVKHKKGVSSSGSGQVVRFALRHPVLIAIALLKRLF